ncbi:MAG: hypothetical protein A2X18_13685 [Bacteroidetes bacterium GWF2_40_14]|nr:MAG: hypothetical protein A2X18_13685 [Bacteroidetes bacterium GWF2_40_14]
MKKTNYRLVLSFLVLMTFFGCKKVEVPYFSGSNSANFWLHQYNYSLFGATTTELPEDTIILDIAIVGRLADYDRYATAKAVPDSAGTPEDKRLTTATPDQYKIIGGIIKANEKIGKFKVLIKNPEVLATRESLKLKIMMAENEDFKIGLRENNWVALTWSRKFLPPATWHAMRFFFCSVYSTQVYKIFMSVTGLKEFYYYEGKVTMQEAYVMGKNFGDRVRALSAIQGSPLLHDDGENAGLPIIPIY